MTQAFFKVLDVEQVLGLRQRFQPVSSEDVLLEAAVGRILAEDVHAAGNLPGFARSTVDGYAVRAASTFGASESSPALFTVVGAVAMGEFPQVAVAAGEAARIATGGMLPPGADGVVMLEHAESLDDVSIEVVRSVAPGRAKDGCDYVVIAREAAASQPFAALESDLIAALGRLDRPSANDQRSKRPKNLTSGRT